MTNKIGESVSYATRDVVWNKFDDIVKDAAKTPTRTAIKEFKNMGKEIVSIFKDMTKLAQDEELMKSVGKTGFGSEVDAYIDKYVSDEVSKAADAFLAAKSGKPRKRKKLGKFLNDPEKVDLMKHFVKIEKNKAVTHPRGKVLLKYANKIGVKAKNLIDLDSAYKKNAALSAKGGKRAKAAGTIARKLDVAISVAKNLGKSTDAVIRAMSPQKRKKR